MGIIIWEYCYNIPILCVEPFPAAKRPPPKQWVHSGIIKTPHHQILSNSMPENLAKFHHFRQSGAAITEQIHFASQGYPPIMDDETVALSALAASAACFSSIIYAHRMIMKPKRPNRSRKPSAYKRAALLRPVQSTFDTP